MGSTASKWIEETPDEVAVLPRCRAVLSEGGRICQYNHLVLRAVTALVDVDLHQGNVFGWTVLQSEDLDAQSAEVVHECYLVAAMWTRLQIVDGGQLTKLWMAACTRKRCTVGRDRLVEAAEMIVLFTEELLQPRLRLRHIECSGDSCCTHNSTLRVTDCEGYCFLDEEIMWQVWCCWERQVGVCMILCRAADVEARV